MGMYTEIYVNVDLSDNTPEKIISLLEQVINGDDIADVPNRWSYMFHSSSYLPNTHCAVLNKCQFMGYSLLGKGSIKNYNSEIEKFFNMIAPYSDTEFMGYMRYEEDDKPTLVFKSEIIKQPLQEGF